MLWERKHFGSEIDEIYDTNPMPANSNIPYL